MAVERNENFEQIGYSWEACPTSAPTVDIIYGALVWSKAESSAASKIKLIATLCMRIFVVHM